MWRLICTPYRTFYFLSLSGSLQDQIIMVLSYRTKERVIDVPHALSYYAFTKDLLSIKDLYIYYVFTNFIRFHLSIIITLIND